MHTTPRAGAQHLGTRRYGSSFQSMYRLAEELPNVSSYWDASAGRVVGPRNVVRMLTENGAIYWYLGRAYQTADGSWAPAPHCWTSGFISPTLINEAARRGVHEAHGNWSA